MNELSRRSSIGGRVRMSTLSKMNISETSGPIATNIYMKPLWDREKAVIGLEADRIKSNE